MYGLNLVHFNRNHDRGLIFCHQRVRIGFDILVIGPLNRLSVISDRGFSVEIGIERSYYRKLWIRCGNKKGGVPFRVGTRTPVGAGWKETPPMLKVVGNGALREAS